MAATKIERKSMGDLLRAAAEPKPRPTPAETQRSAEAKLRIANAIADELEYVPSDDPWYETLEKMHARLCSSAAREIPRGIVGVVSA